MKQALNPVVAGIIIVVALVGCIFWLYKGTNKGGSVAPMATANPSPFGPGGAAVSGGGASPENQSRGRTTGGPPAGIPGGPPPMSGAPSSNR